MTRRSRRTQTPAVKAKVALAALKGNKALAELARAFDVYPDQISTWRAQLLEGPQSVFGGPPVEGGSAPVNLKEVQAKIGQLTLKNDFLAGALTKAGLLSAKK
jgi:transposase-like protein